MRVAVTVEQCWYRVPGGTATAALRVLDEMSSHADLDLIGVAGWHRKPPVDPWVPSIPVRQLPIPSRLVYDSWVRFRWPPVEWFVPGLDVVHSTTIMPPATHRPLVVTVHDLAFLRFPDMFSARGVSMFRRGLRMVRDRADLVLCSSGATLADALDAGVPSNRLRLVPLGVATARSVSDEQRQEVRQRLGLPERFVLAVGTLEPRKNLVGLLRAFERLVGGVNDQGLSLVIVGPHGWGDSLDVPAAVRSRVLATGFVSDQDLAVLYDLALVFCYPSLFEGFGLPVLEAMSYGTPVVTSAGVSTEEVAGGAAILIDPTAPESIAEGIVLAVQRASELSELGLARVAAMSWANVADRTVEAYREVSGR